MVISDYPASSSIRSGKGSLNGSWRAKVVSIAAVFSDAFAIGCGTCLGSYVVSTSSAHQQLRSALPVMTLYALIFVLFARNFGLYRHDAKLLELLRTARILQASTYSLCLLALGSLMGVIHLSVWNIAVDGVLVTLCLAFEKHMLRRPFARWRAMNVQVRNALIIGSNSEARRVFSLLRNSPSMGIAPVAFLERGASSGSRVVYDHDYRFRDHLAVRNGPVTADLLQELEISVIFVAEEQMSSSDLSEIERQAATVGVEVSTVFSGISQRSDRTSNIHSVDGLIIDFGAGYHVDRIMYRFVKRALDLIGATVLILLTLPVLIASAIAVRLSSPGAILFRQERVGENGRLFPMFKFRSMYTSASIYARSPESSEDPRITKVGRVLRRTSLDELPQILNVIRGEMSLVGPRPEMPYVVQKYGVREQERLTVPQGITGVWQLSADRRYAIHDTLEYDLYYILNRGIFLDLAILLHTAAFAMKGI